MGRSDIIGEWLLFAGKFWLYHRDDIWSYLGQMNWGIFIMASHSARGISVIEVDSSNDEGGMVEHCQMNGYL